MLDVNLLGILYTLKKHTIYGGRVPDVLLIFNVVNYIILIYLYKLCTNILD